MKKTHAIIKVETESDSSITGERTFTELFKIETPSSHPDTTDSDEYCLWKYNSSGYSYLEQLGTDDEEKAVEEAEKRIPDYILDSEMLSTTNKVRD